MWQITYYSPQAQRYNRFYHTGSASEALLALIDLGITDITYVERVDLPQRFWRARGT